ncbi:uncharacterized protein LOC130645765 [Hydractinia symbiolongicarpus]|uniref:uncharacterized protein LOC130645765 n=1 Tax=Hydractinia symbiolongicarpus TaxID=13093 RepID=UPI0025507705|nr:uncharacterized protein LOC130645765 [Hydractinia symbiolongicarpus]
MSGNLRERFFSFFLLAVIVREIAASCTTSEGGLTIQCSDEISGKDVSLKVEVEPCKDKPTIALEMKVAGVTFKGDFDASVSIPVPNLTIFNAGWYIVIDMTKDNDYLKLSITLKLKGLGLFFVPTSVKILQRSVPVDCNDLEAWWNSMSLLEKIFVLVGSFVVWVASIVFCCCCHRSRSSNNVQQPAPITEDTSTVFYVSGEVQMPPQSQIITQQS